jgi:methylated-DNA-[protein]-cysteine S-methyltransferase
VARQHLPNITARAALCTVVNIPATLSVANRYRRGMTDSFAYLIRTDSPIGRIEVTSNGIRVTSVAIARDGILPRDALPERSIAVLERARDQLEEYFAGTRRRFRLPVMLSGTSFQRDVWQRLAEVPWGECVSYGRIGADLGRPTAGRAIGGAVACNPLPIVIGCHRVLSTTGRVIGYSRGEGIPTKLWLLRHEGVTLAA